MGELKYHRKRLGLSQKVLAECFHVDQTSISKWELGKSYPDVPIAIELSAFFGISLDVIYDNPLSFSPLRLPIHREIYPNTPSQLAKENEEYEEFSPAMLQLLLEKDEAKKDHLNPKHPENAFWVMRVSDDKMLPKIMESDLVLIRRQSHVENNSIALVSLHGDAGRLYIVESHKNGVALLTHNASYPPQFLTKADWENQRAVILGQALEVRRRF